MSIDMIFNKYDFEIPDEMNVVIYQKEPYNYDETLYDVVSEYIKAIENTLDRKYCETKDIKWHILKEQLLPSFMINQ